jgi:hypothetical protein
LIEAVFEDLLGKLDMEIDRLMSEDETDRGRFTRAYVDAFFQVTRDGLDSPWAALSISCMTDPRLRQLWSEWMRDRLAAPCADRQSSGLQARALRRGRHLARQSHGSGRTTGERTRRTSRPAP